MKSTLVLRPNEVERPTHISKQKGELCIDWNYYLLTLLMGEIFWTKITFFSLLHYYVHSWRKHPLNNIEIFLIKCYTWDDEWLNLAFSDPILLVVFQCIKVQKTGTILYYLNVQLTHTYDTFRWTKVAKTDTLDWCWQVQISRRSLLKHGLPLDGNRHVSKNEKADLHYNW